MAITALALETDLRLGLPGGGDGGGRKKRVYSDILSEENKVASAVVGWPPVCAHRRKSIRYDSESKMYVKVRMDGAPYLRKVDLGNHNGYSELVAALEHLFGCFGIGEALEDSENCEYVPIYEDKDGDWMLIGDVPWEMFVESCKRLRIMKRSNANGVGLHAKDLLKGLGSVMSM